MKPAPLVVLALALLTIPAAIAGAWTGGVVPVGSGGAYAPGVDHVRHLVPADAVGLRLPDASTGAEPLFAMVVPCPPEFACVQVVDPYPCLAVYAPAGAALVRYEFAWTTDPAEADVLLSDLPRFPRAAADPCVAGTGPASSDGESA